MTHLAAFLYWPARLLGRLAAWLDRAEVAQYRAEYQNEGVDR